MMWWQGEPMPSNSWQLHSRATVAERRPWAVLHEDTVTRPDGSRGQYVWVDAPDVVRVLVMLGDGTVPIVQQFHYLAGPMWQLPGGTVDPARDSDPQLGGLPDPHTAALNELEEETGLIPRELDRLAVWDPLPGLTRARVHVYLGRAVTRTTATRLDNAEKDLRVVTVPLTELAAAAVDGRLRCAASAAAVLAVSVGHIKA